MQASSSVYVPAGQPALLQFPAVNGPERKPWGQDAHVGVDTLLSTRYSPAAQPHLGVAESHKYPVCSVQVTESAPPGTPSASHTQVRSFSSSPLKNGHISGLQTGLSGSVIESHKNPFKELHLTVGPNPQSQDP